MYEYGFCPQYPMYGREYVYVRRYKVDPDSNVMVLVSRAVEHPQFPVTDKFVRVHTYISSMVIRPHTTFDEVGSYSCHVRVCCLLVNHSYYEDPVVEWISFSNHDQ